MPCRRKRKTSRECLFSVAENISPVEHPTGMCASEVDSPCRISTPYTDTSFARTASASESVRKSSAGELPTWTRYRLIWHCIRFLDRWPTSGRGRTPGIVGRDVNYAKVTSNTTPIAHQCFICQDIENAYTVSISRTVILNSIGASILPCVDPEVGAFDRVMFFKYKMAKTI